MLNAIFSAVLNMSITASIVIIVVLLARLLLKRAPKIFSYALWAVVLFRLLCPVALTSGFSIMNFLRAPTTDTGRIEYVSLNTDGAEEPIFTISVPATELNQTATPLPEEELPWIGTLEIPVSVLSTIWICGVTAMLMFNIVQLIRLRRKLIGATPIYDNVYRADHIPTPFVMGLLHPRIYLPSVISDSEQSYIIQHEKHHIHRGDHVIKVLAFAAVCIHWFNPLAWLAFALSGKDMEMSCDEAVMRSIAGDIRADYSRSLLQFSTGKRIIIGTPLAFGEGETKERIKNIMKYKKPTFIIVALALALCLILTACLSSNPQSDAGEPGPSDNTVNNGDNPVSDNTVYPISIRYADEGVLSNGHYHDWTAHHSEHTVKLLFAANEVLTDVCFSSLQYDDNGDLCVGEEFCTLSELTSDKPLVAGVEFYGSMTTYGISFVDADGKTHYCSVSVSGEDGSLVMNEYHSCFAHSCSSH